MIISLEYVYDIAGIFMAFIAFLSFRDTTNPRRLLTGSFWGLFAISFLFGKFIPPVAMGVLVIIMAVIAGVGGVRMGQHEQASEEEQSSSSQKLGNKLFIPALLIPVITIICSVGLKNAKIGDKFLLDNTNVTLVSLGVACVVALIAALSITKGNPGHSVKESRRLIDAIGWASVLPQMLATLGGLFAAAGVGKVVSDLVSSAIPVDNRFLVVVAYVVGMALFTMVMGNAFAAFPVMTAGIGIPLILHMHGGQAVVMAAIGMYSGYCGTLLTPMAANFNIVPAALLDIPKNDVIRAQVPTALILLTVNIFLMYFLVF